MKVRRPTRGYYFWVSLRASGERRTGADRQLVRLLSHKLAGNVAFLTARAFLAAAAWFTGVGPTGSGATPSVGPAGSTLGCATTFAGRWKTRHGDLTIGVRGNQASGTYGSGRPVSGLIRGNVLEGTWRHGSGRSGGVRFTHHGNGTFTGSYGEKDGPMRSSWNGTSLGAVPGAVSSTSGFAGMCAPVSGTGGRGICQDPRVEQLMNDWLSRAIPPQKPGASLRYDCWGRALGSANPGLITANQRPDTDARTRCEYLLDHSGLYTSTNLGTMRQYLDQNR